MKMIGHDHFICHSYCHFSVLKDIKKIDESGKKRGIIIPYDMLSGW